jgi:hypothetical protein
MAQSYVPYPPILAQSKGNFDDSRGDVSPHYDRTVERVGYGSCNLRDTAYSGRSMIIMQLGAAQRGNLSSLLAS